MQRDSNHVYRKNGRGPAGVVVVPCIGPALSWSESGVERHVVTNGSRVVTTYMIVRVMGTNEVGIGELKTHLSALLRRVQRGESLTVTDRGTPVARIVPAAASPRDAMAALQDAR